LQALAHYRPPFTLDLGRAALALALSVVLYLFAVNETNPDTTSLLDFTIVPEPVNIPPGLVSLDRPPPVRLRVRAPVNVINRLRPESFVAQVDASGAVAGDNNLPVNVRSLDTQVGDVNADPPRAALRLEAVQERVLPVRANLTGQVPSGYQVGLPTSDPPQVTASGPSSVVGRAVEAVIDVSVDRVSVSVNGIFTPRALDERGNELTNLQLSPASVNAKVPIVQQTQYKEVGIRPTITGQPQAGYYLEPVEVNPPTVTLVGEPAALAGANFATTQPVDVTGLTTTVVRSVGLTAPAGTILLQPGQTVMVTVRVAPLTVTSTIQVQPSAVNVASGLLVVNQPAQVAVTISGPQPTLSGLGARDFRAVVDMAGKGPGRYDVQPLVQNVPAGMAVDGVSPKTVSVELRELPTPTPMPTAAATATPAP